MKSEDKGKGKLEYIGVVEAISGNRGIAMTVILVILCLFSVLSVSAVQVSENAKFQTPGTSTTFVMGCDFTFDKIEVHSTYLMLDNAAISVHPSAGSMTFTLFDFSTDYKKWSEECSNPAATTTHTLGGLKTNTPYLVIVSGATYGSYTSNNSGYVSFTYSGRCSDVVFEMKENESSTIIPTSSPSPSATPTSSPTSTLEPTLTPTPTATPVATPAPTPPQHPPTLPLYLTPLLIVGIIALITVIIGVFVIRRKKQAKPTGTKAEETTDEEKIEEVKIPEPEEVRERLRETYPEKDAARLANTFRVVQEIRSSYCNTDTTAKDISKEFDLLKMYFTEKEFLDEVENVQRRINAELREDERLDETHVKEVKDFCGKFTEMWIAKFLR